MKILITGTHFTPAQAVIKQLKKYPDMEIIYIGRKHTREGDKSTSVESEVLPKLGVKFIPLIAGRIQRVFTIYTFSSLLKVPIGFVQALYILWKENPEVILSFGGYVGVPVVVCGWLLSIPIIIHEQTLVPGLANQVSGIFANKIALSFPERVKKNQSKVIFTGNPLRDEIIQEKKLSADVLKEYDDLWTLAQKNKLPVVMIMGGNQGSHVINQVVNNGLSDLLAKACVILHTGDSKFQDYEAILAKKESITSGNRIVVKKWIEGEVLGYLLRRVDVVVSRAGINTLLELSYLKVPAIVVPIPYASNNEQKINAQYFEKKGLVKMLEQKNLTVSILLKSIDFVIKDDQMKKDDSLSKLSIDADKKLALETVLLVRDKFSS